jgi:hypothetical protein
MVSIKTGWGGGGGIMTEGVAGDTIATSSRGIFSGTKSTV